MSKTISVIGGDLRQITLASLLEQDNFRVKIFGFDKELDTGVLKKAKDIRDAAMADIIILPLPASLDNITVNCPFSDSDINIENLLEHSAPHTIFFGGKLSKKLTDLLAEHSLLAYDYLEREELSIANAIPTAEGAIEIALGETPFTLHNAPCLVIGYGRIGKILSQLLKGFGSKVCVSARKCSDFAMIDALGYKHAHSNHLEGIISDYKIIFNTVPTMVLDKKLLSKIPKDSLVIDLASKPGGVDFSMAKELGLKVIWALSLPGKVAPITSGEIIKNTVVNILNEMEVL